MSEGGEILEKMSEVLEKLKAIEKKLDAIIKINLIRAIYPKEKLDLYDDEFLKDLIDLGIDAQIIAEIQEFHRKWEEE